MIRFRPTCDQGLGHMGPDFLCFLRGPSEQDACIREHVHFDDLSYLDQASADVARTGRKRLGGNLYTQSTYKVLAMIFECH